eukprot:scaffold1991_cov111-Isochrysis_galbana.AAC.11
MLRCPGLVEILVPRWQGLVSRCSSALTHGTVAGTPPRHTVTSMSAAAHTSSKWVLYGPLPERHYALNIHRKVGAWAARALPMRLVCSWRRLLDYSL